MNEDRLKKWKEQRQKRKQSLNHDELLAGILAGDLQSLSSGITLLESDKAVDKKIAQQLVTSCLKHSGNSIRLGITGVPGVGKSTFIESFGQTVVQRGYKIAVLAIDPSSERSGGSILGDKTRMNKLSVLENAFIRPSAAGKSLGGVARKTRESIVLCEAAGYDFILIETVGVGQSETMVHSMVDFFMLLMLKSEEHTSELQSRPHLVCRLLLEKKNLCAGGQAVRCPPADPGHGYPALPDPGEEGADGGFLRQVAHLQCPALLHRYLRHALHCRGASVPAAGVRSAQRGGSPHPARGCGGRA